MKGLIRWFLFIPVAVFVSVIADMVLRFVFLRFGSGLLFAKSYLETYKIFGIDLEWLFTMFFAVVTIPFLTSLFSVYSGVYVAPQKKLALIILLCLTIVSVLFSLIVGYMAVVPSLAYVLGGIMAYYNLKEK